LGYLLTSGVDASYYHLVGTNPCPTTGRSAQPTPTIRVCLDPPRAAQNDRRASYWVIQKWLGLGSVGYIVHMVELGLLHINLLFLRASNIAPPTAAKLMPEKPPPLQPLGRSPSSESITGPIKPSVMEAGVNHSCAVSSKCYCPRSYRCIQQCQATTLFHCAQ